MMSQFLLFFLLYAVNTLKKNRYSGCFISLDLVKE